MRPTCASPNQMDRSNQMPNQQKTPKATRPHFVTAYASRAGRDQWAARASKFAIHAIVAAIVALGSPAWAQQGAPLGDPYVEYRTATGSAPCASCKLYFYLAGTSTPTDTYSDAQLTSANTNPVTLDSAGRALVFLSDRAYKVTLTTAGGSQIWTADNVVGRTPPTNVLSKSADYTVAVTDGKDVLIKADSSGAAFTITLYTAVGNSGRVVSVKKTDSSYNAITIDPNGSQTIDGASTFSLTDPNDAVELISDGANWQRRASTVAVPLEPRLAEGRLTLESGVAVSTSDQSAKTAVYWTPYQGNRIELYSGSRWVWRTFTETSESLTSCTASTPYDIFAYDNAGTVDLELTAWTNATTRATALTTQDGVPVKSGATTRRYLGSVYCNATGGQTDHTLAKRYLWNAYNRVQCPLYVAEATDSWTYNTATFRQARNSTANQLDVMVGLALEAISVDVLVHTGNSGSNETVVAAIGEDSTSAAASNSLIDSWNSQTGHRERLHPRLQKTPAVGRHYYTWLEYATNGGTATWLGDNGTPTILQSGMSGMWSC